MSCGKSSACLDRGSVPVYLNVYDLTPFNGYAYWLGLGAYHSGLEVPKPGQSALKKQYLIWGVKFWDDLGNAVHGVEYAFGAHEYPSTGIFEGKPKQSEGFTFRETILVGTTDMGPAAVRSAMEELAEVYRGNAYNIITKNCNHFCNDACLRLTGNPIPSWVNRLARIGFLCKCVLPATLNSTKVRHHGSEDKSDKEEKKLTSESNELPSSNSLSRSSSSPSDHPTRGRSRSRTPRTRLSRSP